ncbi:SDR family NAD(P)-dependent oxidoreductase [Kaistia dalseonensis]|uniref:NAD(P)-dependent dehydrogenase (Short-subunit alcohol dehydrogenase family) n=1 Tax=Kaistia dalseonensis TaxID=410840 RepID=A0ABU0H0Y2_9HYPH|nr:SDR family oxidoreductase [Kaistia dalseonensis]MCX5493409.1 SDR family NAD(P)-dependent oxidoreductase [Kaistia dalseonensis]MDQ0435967.1 NAD(P)-dependent dehydrogenase (short-subunit alcohol dehydrogenase family) [Kaistia dalseonensis]
MSDMDGKVVLITGGSSGIGRATALHLAGMGAQVAVTGRRRSALDALVAGNPNLMAIVADTGIPDDAAHTIDAVVGKWRRLDVLINNAGAGALLPLHEVTASRISDILAVNVIGPSLLAKVALPHLTETQGSVINVSSTFGHKAGTGLSHYAASKAALEHLTRCWALELAPLGIRVNAVAAGPTASGALTGMMGLSPEHAAVIEEAEREQIPLKRRGTPDDIAAWISHLVGPAGAWVTGQVISVDGGLGLT